jgi:hypothetical protein
MPTQKKSSGAEFHEVSIPLWNRPSGPQRDDWKRQLQNLIESYERTGTLYTALWTPEELVKIAKRHLQEIEREEANEQRGAG